MGILLFLSGVEGPKNNLKSNLALVTKGRNGGSEVAQLIKALAINEVLSLIPDTHMG